AVASVSVYVRGAAENCSRSPGNERPLQQDGALAVGFERIVDDHSWNDFRVFTGAADQLGLVVRGVDVWRHRPFHRPRGILFLCIWTQENRCTGSGPTLIIIFAGEDYGKRSETQRSSISDVHQWRIRRGREQEIFSGGGSVHGRSDGGSSGGE